MVKQTITVKNAEGLHLRPAAVFAQEVTLLDIVRALTAGQRLFVEGDMADEIKVIHIGHVLFGFHALQIDALLPQEITDGGFLALRRPLADEVFERRIAAENV